MTVLFSVLVLLWFFRDPDFLTGWGPLVLLYFTLHFIVLLHTALCR